MAGRHNNGKGSDTGKDQPGGPSHDDRGNEDFIKEDTGRDAVLDTIPPPPPPKDDK